MNDDPLTEWLAKKIAEDVGDWEPDDGAYEIARMFRRIIPALAAEMRTELLHPEFGSEWQEPDGLLYKEYRRGLAEGWDVGRADGHAELRPINAFGETMSAKNPYTAP